MEPIDRTDFVRTCRTALDLARSPEVADQWGDESACAGMTVGGLASHLLTQPRHVADAVGRQPTADAPIALLEHYARAEWVTAAPEDEANTSIRDGSNESAANGPAPVLAEAEAVIGRLPELLAAAREPDTIHIPWQGWSLTTDDFLVTRSMELVVHSDDLAASVGLPTPAFPETIVERVVHLLTGVALRRHGQAAVVRSLSRPQRAPDSVSAF